MNAPKFFTARFDTAQIHDFNDVSDAICAAVNRAESVLLLLTDLAEITGRGGERETMAIYGAIIELNDIHDLATAYRDHIKQESRATPNTDGAAIVARLRDYANDLEQPRLSHKKLA
jgi:hypothetical protein